MRLFFNKLLKKSIFKDFLLFIVSLIFFIMLSHFIRFPIVDGESMYPTYDTGDRLVVFYTTNVKDNDIAVIWSDELDEHIVKRVIGVAGDHIAIKDDKLFRNNVPLYEPYINEQNWITPIQDTDFIVPDGYIYVLGDNRNDSADSRLLGMFESKDIFGKAIYDFGKN